VYRAAFDRVCGELDRHLAGVFEVPVAEAVFGGPEGGLGLTGYGQVGVFALGVALWEVLRGWGVVVGVGGGGSGGGVAGGDVSGVWDLADACVVVAARARLMQGLPSGGAMAAVAMSEAEAGGLAGVVVAAVNGPGSVVVAGAVAA